MRTNKEVRTICNYCRESKIHPAFKAEDLCLSCASEVIEDFAQRKEQHNSNLKQLNDKTNKATIKQG